MPPAGSSATQVRVRSSAQATPATTSSRCRTSRTTPTAATGAVCTRTCAVKTAWRCIKRRSSRARRARGPSRCLHSRNSRSTTCTSTRRILRGTPGWSSRPRRLPRSTSPWATRTQAARGIHHSRAERIQVPISATAVQWRIPARWRLHSTSGRRPSWHALARRRTRSSTRTPRTTSNLRSTHCRPTPRW